MKKIAFVASAVSALLGAAMLYLYMMRFENEASGGPRVSVVVATRAIPLGTLITSEMLGVRALPQSYVEPRHVRASDANRILGVRVNSSIRANESVLWTDLATAEQQRDLSGLVTTGMRAVTIRADLASSFGGLLRPGDRVDVLLTVERGKDRTTVPILQNLLVLAIGSDTGGAIAAEDARRVGQVHQVTLSVTLEQAQTFAVAQDGGRLTLALRHPDDIAVVEGLPEKSFNEVLRKGGAAIRPSGDGEGTS